MTHDYHTIFEIGMKSFPWLALLRPMILVAAGLLLVRFSRRRPQLQLIGALGAIVGALLLLMGTSKLVPEFMAGRRTYQSGQSRMVEGTVDDFHPAPVLLQGMESFQVGGVRFSYLVGGPSPCFQNDRNGRGMVHAGSHVRIYYRDGCIERVDLWQ